MFEGLEASFQKLAIWLPYSRGSKVSRAGAGSIEAVVLRGASYRGWPYIERDFLIARDREPCSYYSHCSYKLPWLPCILGYEGYEGCEGFEAGGGGGTDVLLKELSY